MYYNNFDDLHLLNKPSDFFKTETSAEDYIIDLYDNKNHNLFGAIPYNSCASTKEEKIVYQSGWVIGDIQKEYFTNYRTYLFEFDKYVDAPSYIIQTRNIPAKTGTNFSLTTISSFTTTYETITEFSLDILYEICNSTERSIGVSIPIYIIELNESITNSLSLSLSSTFHSYFFDRYQATYYFETLLSENINYFNNYNHPIYIQPNYRQKYKLYFAVNTYYDYWKKETRSGLFDLDITTNYLLNTITVENVYCFLIPVDNPYFDVSKYYDNEDGVKTILEKSHPNIIYF